MKSLARKYKKIDFETFSREKFEVQQYFKELTVANSKFLFKMKSRLTARVANNFHGDRRFKAIGYQCIGCLRDKPITEQLDLSYDTEEHITRCDSYAFLRLNNPMSTDEQVIQYFKDVISLREKDWG